MIVVLHSIRSVFNVGSIFRTADAVGIEKIYLCGITPGPLDKFDLERKNFTKVSLGAEKFVSWERKYSTIQILKKLKVEGYEVIAVEQDPRSIPYRSYRHSGLDSESNKILKRVQDDDNTCLVMGAEVGGLPKSILDLSDKIIEIPMKGKKESLNVSVAFGIAAYHLTLGSLR